MRRCGVLLVVVCLFLLPMNCLAVGETVAAESVAVEAEVAAETEEEAEMAAETLAEEAAVTEEAAAAEEMAEEAAVDEAAAEAEPFRDEALAEKFATGEILVAYTEKPEGLTATELVLSEEAAAFFGVEVDDASKTAMLEQYQSQGALPGTVAPSGSAALYWVGATPVCVKDSRAMVVFPALERGVGEIEGKMDSFLNMAMSGLAGYVPVWSHDENYVAVVNYNARMFTDPGKSFPALIDMTTGELVFFDELGERYMDGGQILCGACFSPDDRYLYYLKEGINEDKEYQISLCRFDLETEEMECLISMGREMSMAFPGLYMTEDGEVFYAAVDLKMPEQGIVCVREEDGEWSAAMDVFGLTNVRLNAFRYSENSGLMLITGETAAQRAGVFQVYDPEAAAGGEASWWAIAFDDEFRPSLIEIDAETMTQPDEAAAEQMEADLTEAGVTPLAWSVLSPDGYYAALYYPRVDGGRLVMLSLETMDIVLMKGVDNYGIYESLPIPVAGFNFERIPPVQWLQDIFRVTVSRPGSEEEMFAVMK